MGRESLAVGAGTLAAGLIPGFDAARRRLDVALMSPDALQKNSLRVSI
jgi:hypothetical protein